jgi:aldehyde:ferredoxin oxidoreductase
MLQEYYEFRGWDEQGVPLPETLKELELDSLLQSMEAVI